MSLVKNEWVHLCFDISFAFGIWIFITMITRYSGEVGRGHDRGPCHVWLILAWVFLRRLEAPLPYVLGECVGEHPRFI